MDRVLAKGALGGSTPLAELSPLLLGQEGRSLGRQRKPLVQTPVQRPAWDARVAGAGSPRGDPAGEGVASRSGGDLWALLLGRKREALSVGHGARGTYHDLILLTGPTRGRVQRSGKAGEERGIAFSQERDSERLGPGLWQCRGCAVARFWLYFESRAARICGQSGNIWV